MATIRIFLSVVAVLYAGFAVWCALRPVSTAESLGYTLANGSGRSEYIAVYGGLQMGLAAVFALAVWNEAYAAHGGLLCWMVHGGMVLFRAATLVLIADIAWNTYAFAGLEFVLFAVSLGLWWTLT